MMDAHQSSNFGSSPGISIELILHGERFSVASMGLNGLVIRAPKPLGRDRAVVTMAVGKHITRYDVLLPDGIDPGRHHQPFSIASMATETKSPSWTSTPPVSFLNSSIGM